jgi:hypothetical protein
MRWYGLDILRTPLQMMWGRKGVGVNFSGSLGYLHAGIKLGGAEPNENYFW